MQLFALVKSADTVISVDTGIVHIAAAFDKNTTAFFEEGMLSWRPIHQNYSLVLCTVPGIIKCKRHYVFDGQKAEQTIKTQLSKLMQPAHN